MRKETKIIIASVAVAVMLFSGLFICLKIYMDYHDAKFYEQVAKIKVGMTFDHVKETLPYEIYRSCTEQQEVELWADTKDNEIVNNCDLYYFVDSKAIQYLLVYVDKQTRRVRLVSTQHQ